MFEFDLIKREPLVSPEPEHRGGGERSSTGTSRTAAVALVVMFVTSTSSLAKRSSKAARPPWSRSSPPASALERCKCGTASAGMRFELDSRKFRTRGSACNGRRAHLRKILCNTGNLPFQRDDFVDFNLMGHSNAPSELARGFGV
eukprot:1179870-Prorocentrum_minimum.AAC.4